MSTRSKEVNQLAFYNENIVKVIKLNYKEEIIYEKQKIGFLKYIKVPVSTVEILESVEYQIPGELGDFFYINRKPIGWDYSDFKDFWRKAINLGTKIVAQIDHIRYVK